MKICIIEDDMMVRNTLSKVLTRCGHMVFTCPNGLDGLQTVEAKKPDLVITDIIMPVMEGIEVIRRLRGMSPELKIIAMSGGGRVGNTDFLKVAKSVGADSVLYKPVTRAEVLEAIETCKESVKHQQAVR